MRYEGPIYRPPSEAGSLLIQATVGCPHNRCTFCLVYKNIRFKVRPVQEIREDLEDAARVAADRVRTLFFPAGNTIAMPTTDLAEICRQARSLFPRLTRITVYGSSQFIMNKGDQGLHRLAEAGLKRVHVGWESGDNDILAAIRKGASREVHAAAVRLLKAAGLEVNAYVMLGIGGQQGSERHARRTAALINEAPPDVLRLRTFVPKVNTPLLQEVLAGRFRMLSPHQVLAETAALLEGITVPLRVESDHYSNYLNVSGNLPQDRDRMLTTLKQALTRPESDFRPFFIGTE
uniref:Radical SAM protein n=1 Tax=Desulfobacca acetoxidans TaxID=60893 RepID=A0A7C3UZM3_9BACT